MISTRVQIEGGCTCCSHHHREDKILVFQTTDIDGEIKIAVGGEAVIVQIEDLKKVLSFFSHL